LLRDEYDKLEDELGRLNFQLDNLIAEQRELFHEHPTLRFRRPK
jgi:hypothetical protein